MINVAKEWNSNQALLKELLKKEDKFNDAIELCYRMHSLVHSSKVSGTTTITYADRLWDGLNEKIFRNVANNASIAWHIWHLARIEDITVNILIAGGPQVFNTHWQEKLNIKAADTGNTMSSEAVAGLSNAINMAELHNYRIAVGKKTGEIISKLNYRESKRKMDKDRLQRILDEGAVLENARFLVDFWGRKNVSGLLLMPVTRHQVIHLNSALKIKMRKKV